MQLPLAKGSITMTNMEAKEPTPDGSKISITIDANVRLASSLDYSTFTSTVKAAWEILAARYADSDEVVVGEEVGGQSSTRIAWTEKIQRLIQQSQLSLRDDETDKNMTPLSNGNEITRTTAASIRSSKACVDIDCGTSISILLIINEDSQGMTLIDDHDSTTHHVMNSSGESFQIAIHYYVQDGTVNYLAMANTDIIEKQVQRLVRQHANILRQISDSNNVMNEISTIELVDEQDLREIWSCNAVVPKAIEGCIHDLIAATAVKQADTIAVDAWDGSLTYAELELQSTQLAKGLASLGVNKGVAVALYFEKSVRVPIAMLAVMKAGGVVVLLAADLPGERLRYICEQSKATLAITSKGGIETIRAYLLSFTFDEVYLRGEQAEAGEYVYAKPTHDDLSFIVFTSGSTGNPKGIIWSHEGLCMNTERSGKAFGISSDTRNFQFASYMFDVSILETLTVLSYGGCVCIPSERDRINNLAFVITSMRANWICLTPSTSDGISPEQVPSLKTIVFGGEFLKAEQAFKWGEHVNVINCYGPAEGSFCTFCPVVRSEWKQGSIGRSTTGVCWIVDPSDCDKLVPIGAIGELMIEGGFIAKGYLGDSVKTAAAFVEDPPWLLAGAEEYSGRQGKLYRTGDLVRYDLMGGLTFVGRKDSQVKIRGQRVELEEIEYQIFRDLTGTCVTRVVAEVVVPAATSNAVLVAYVHIKNDQELSQQHLGYSIEGITKGWEERLLTSLPSYMIPHVYIPIATLPMTATGKVDRRQLREMGKSLTMEQLGGHRQRHQLNGASEVKLAELWAQVLGLRPGSISANDNFVQIGGDSIKLMTLVPLINSEFGVQLSIQTFMKQKSLRQVAQQLSEYCPGPSETESREVDELILEARTLAGRLCDDCMPVLERRRTFLTGATGYLGTSVLHELLHRPQTHEVVVLVRAKSIEEARQRIITSAKKAGWWLEKFDCQVIIWLGDLALPKLGLPDSKWNKLRGRYVDFIIHNGAVVNWYSSYEDLHAINVLSTHQLLKVAASSQNLQRFVYVSTGPEENDVESKDKIERYLREQLPGSNGYWQSKLVAEKLISLACCMNQLTNARIGIIKPGFIIGSTQDGISNIDDFIWRVVAGAVSIGSYPQQERDSWIYLSSCDDLARVIVDTLHDTSSDRRWMKSMRCGLRLSQFWAAVNAAVGSTLQQIPFSLWLDLIKQKSRGNNNHPTLPVLHEIKEDGLGLGTIPIELLSQEMMDSEKEMIAAVQSNVTYLLELGFFGENTMDHLTSGVFRRAASRS